MAPPAKNQLALGARLDERTALDVFHPNGAVAFEKDARGERAHLSFRFPRPERTQIGDRGACPVSAGNRRLRQAETLGLAAV